MPPIYLFFYTFVIFGYTVSKTEAGILNRLKKKTRSTSNQPLEPDQFQSNGRTAGNTDFNPTSLRTSHSHSKLLFADPKSSKSLIGHQMNSRISDVPTSSRVTSEYENNSELPDSAQTDTILLSDSSTLGLPLGDSSHSIVHFTKIPTSSSTSILYSVDPNSSRLPLEDSSNSITTYEDLNYNNQSFNTQSNVNTPTLFSQNQSWPEESNQDQVQQILADLSRKTTKSYTKATPDYDKILNENFPQMAKLLEQIKKLGKFKTQQEPTKVAHKGKTIKKTTITTTAAYNKDAIADLLKPLKNLEDKSTTASNQMRVIMRKLKKTRFYYKSKPVKSERDQIHTTVYYIDL